MTAKVSSNVFKRGKDFIRLAFSKQSHNVEVRQPKTELSRLHPSPTRSNLFTSRVSYKTIASQLRRRAAFEFRRPQRLPFFGFVGLALATSKQNENEKLTEDIREVLQNQIKTSPIIQQLSLDSFDLGQVIGKGCNAVVFEARQKDGKEFDNSSDEEEEDKWYPPTEEYLEEEPSQSFSVIDISEGETTMSSFSVNEREINESFSFIESREGTLNQHNFDDEISVESMSISTESSDIESENTESEEECDIDEEGIGTGSIEDTTSIKYNLDVKMMFNYEVESKADSIMKAMEKETVPARVPIYQLGDSWYFRNRVRLKSLPQHPNIVDMIGAFVDPFNMPQLSVAMETYPAALPKRQYSSGLGRNMTMNFVMKKYDMTLKEYLEQHKPDVRTRCLLLTQLLEGIVHLGNHGIAHRDIKTDNLFLEFSEQSVPKLVIGDFGCCLADTEFEQKLPYFTSDVDRGGNCLLMAPEISTAIPGRDIWLDYSKADLWTVGTIIYELFSVDNPFYGNQSGQGLLDSRTYSEQNLPSLPDTVPNIVKLLVRLCLSRDPTKRPTATDAANLMQIYLWLPEWFVFKPDMSDIKEHLLILTAQVILHEKHMDPDDQPMSTFLQRLKLEDIIRIIDNFTEVEY
ncbi:serine/threonine-protein kinase Pink1, mitochondrial-like isoform X2 [Mytilus californianus]|uniref:serine/threonine-protein kinase Pink1, mitochondrial-like isoform X2 n=1 Tax=Mytilus californianus TaxID=6549 RepID=UPI0022458212|nr:serine/threonine-protein kinase Pink1, mitochondrial-like isoform X2 [Mytilus californianus]